MVSGKRSTISALLSIIGKLIEGRREGYMAMAIYDLSAAFDCLDPDILTQKLKLYGLDENSCNWFLSFLTGRQQYVVVGEKKSEKVKINTGTPQGSILSPLLFII